MTTKTSNELLPPTKEITSPGSEQDFSSVPAKKAAKISELKLSVDSPVFSPTSKYAKQFSTKLPAVVAKSAEKIASVINPSSGKSLEVKISTRPSELIPTSANSRRDQISYSPSRSVQRPVQVYPDSSNSYSYPLYFDGGPSSYTCPYSYQYFPMPGQEFPQEGVSPQPLYSTFERPYLLDSPLSDYQFPALYYATPPSILGKKNLSFESSDRLQKLVQKKIFVSLKEKSKLQTLPEIIGEVSIYDLLSVLKSNLEKCLPDLILDIRLAGSGANSVIFGQPQLDALRDVDIVFYLKFTPVESSEIADFLTYVSSVFESTLASFVSHSQVREDPMFYSIIRNCYLSNHKLVNDDASKWLLTGTGLLDLRFNLQATREYTSSDYSFQVSLLENYSYCLFGDRESAERDFFERQLVIPRPTDMPNCLARTLLELNRHDHYSTADFIPIVENYLQSSSPECFISVLENHLHKEALYKRSFGHVISLINATALSSSCHKTEVLQKAVLMFEREFKISDFSASFDEKVKRVINGTVDLGCYTEALTLIELFQKTESISLSESLLYLLEKSSPLEPTSDLFEKVQYLALKENSEKSRLVLIKLFEKMRASKSHEPLLKLVRKIESIPSFFEKKYLDFYLSVIEFFSMSKSLDLLKEAKNLLNMSKTLMPKDTCSKLNSTLIDKFLDLNVLEKDLILGEFNSDSFFEDKLLLNKILDFSFKVEGDGKKETLDFIGHLVDRWRKTSSFASLKFEETSKLERFYQIKILKAQSIDSIIEEIEDLSIHPIFSQKEELVLDLINKLEGLLPTLHFKNALKVYNFLSSVIYSPFVEKPLFREKLKNIIPPLSFVLSRSSVHDKGIHKNGVALSRAKALFLLTKQHNILSSEEFSKMAFTLSELFLKNEAVKDALSFLIYSLPGFEDKRSIAKKISQMFSLPILPHKIRLLKKHEEVFVQHLDKSSLGMIYQSLIQTTKKAYDQNPRKIENRNQLFYLLEKALLLNLHKEKAFASFAVNLIASYDPGVESEIFTKEEEELLSRYLSDLSGQVEPKLIEQFKVKIFKKYLSLSLEKNDLAFRIKAMEIFDSHPEFCPELSSCLLEHLVYLSKKGQDPQTIFSLISTMVPHIKSLPGSDYKEHLSFILSSYKPCSSDALISYLELLDLLIANNIAVEELVLRTPLDFFRKEVSLCGKDKSKKENVLLIYKVLQNSLFWKSPLLDREKKDIFFSLVPVFQDSIEKINVLHSFTERNITESLSKYKSRKENPWLHFTRSQYKNIHSAFISWLDCAESLANVEDIISFYDLMRKFELSSKESFSQKLEVFSKIFEIYLSDYQKIKLDPGLESLRVLLLSKVFISWLKVVEKDIKTMNLDDFETASSVLTFNLWKYFTSDKPLSTKLFYEILEKEGVTKSLSLLVKRVCGSNLNQIIKPSEDTLLPPQAILQTIIAIRFPLLCFANRCFRETFDH